MTTEEAIDLVADRLVAQLEGLPHESDDSPVKAYKWAANPGAGFDSVPAAVVQIPKIQRTKIDEAERQLGSLDLNLRFEVFFVFDASDVTYTMPQSVATVAAFIDAIDADITLSGSAEEAKVTEADPRNVETKEGGRPLFGWACSVEVFVLI
jgi:hypothetical protein